MKIMLIKLAALATLLFNLSVYAEPGALLKSCFATKTLSEFERALKQSGDGKTIMRMREEGLLFIVDEGTRGYIREEQNIRRGTVPLYRFAYNDNPNGNYGVWLLTSCFSSQ